MDDSDAMTILIALHWVADGWKIYLFSRQLSVAKTTDVPPKLQEWISAQDYDLARRKSQQSSLATILTVGVFLIIKTIKLLFHYNAYVWELTSYYADSMFWRAILYTALDVWFSKLLIVPLSLLAAIMSPRHEKPSLIMVFLASTWHIVFTAISYSFTIACLMLIVDDLGPSVLLYAAPVTNGIGLIVLALYIRFFVPHLLHNIENEATLQPRMKRLTDVVGYPANRVFLDPNASAAPNAYYMGVLGSNMIVLTHRLVDILNPQQLSAVVAHELGHWSREHNIVQLFLSLIEISILSCGMAYAYDNRTVIGIFEFAKDRPHSVIPLCLWLTYVSPLFADMLHGIKSTIGRLCEFYADDFARDLGLGTNLKSALLTLASKSTAYPIFDPLFSAWYLGHPTIFERVERIETHATSN